MNAVAQTPGPGGWEIDLTHFPRPPSPIGRALYTTVFPDALAEGFAALGLLLETLQLRAHGEGFVYTQPKVVGAPAGSPPPPGAVLWLVSRLHPAMRARSRRLSEVLETRAWRADAAAFHADHKPALVVRHRGLLREDPAHLDLPALVDHLRRCHDALRQAVWVHGRFTVASQFPMGDFVAHASEWTGRPASELLALVVGHAPASAGLSPELDRLVEALRAEPAAMALLEDEDPDATLAALQGRPGPVGLAAADWIALVGWRTVAAYDVAEPVALEYPFLLVSALRAAVQGRLRPATPDALAHATLRDLVPDRHRPAFDGLLDEARALSSLRDERTLYSDYWATGILRRALLECGRRLVARGWMDRPELACMASVDELVGLLEGGDAPAGQELERRWQARHRAHADVPASFGTVSPPPPSRWFPEPAARGIRAVQAVLDAMFVDAPNEGMDAGVQGHGVSAGVYEGPVRRVAGPDDFHRLRPGDVLVAPMTSPVYNVVLPMLGALVTDRGGALSHAAIVSREFGIPGVVGCRDATAKLRDGERVRVDGAAGTVRPLAVAR